MIAREVRRDSILNIDRALVGYKRKVPRSRFHTLLYTVLVLALTRGEFVL